MGKIYYDMGFLSTPDVIECSASDLIGQYVGQTSPKTKAQLENALGKVLFVDEAYRLADGQYAAEAVHEFIYLLGTPRYSGKMIVILAGYSVDMSRLMAVRPSLSSLFPDEIVFEKLKPAECLSLLDRELEKRRISASFLKNPSSPGYRHLAKLFRILSVFPTWSNARDIKTLAAQMSSVVFEVMAQGHTRELFFEPATADACIRRMIALQRERCNTSAGKAGCPTPNQTGEDSLARAQDEAPQDNTATHADTATAKATDQAPLICTPHRTKEAAGPSGSRRTNTFGPSSPQDASKVQEEIDKEGE